MDETTADRLSAVAEATADDVRFPVEALDVLRSSGLLGLGVPEEYGGSPTSLLDEIRAIYEVGRASASLGSILAMHLQQVQAVVRYGSTSLKRSVLPGIARGEVYLGSVTTEAGTGGDLRSSTAALRHEDGRALVSREAPIVTGGEFADAFLVKMGEENGGSSLVYVPRAGADVEVRPNSWNPMGMGETGSVGLRLEATVPEDHVVGGAGAFDSIVSETFGPYAHLGWAATWLGAAAAAGDRLIAAIREQPQLRRKVLDSQLSLARLAHARAELDCVRDALATTLELYEAEERDPLLLAVRVNGLKTIAATKCFNAVHLMVELGGLPHGYMKTSPTRIEKVFRDLRSASMNYSNDRLDTENGKLILRLGFKGVAPT